MSRPREETWLEAGLAAVLSVVAAVGVVFLMWAL
jgi:hypothetical protein